jgi:hypothetical protein
VSGARFAPRSGELATAHELADLLKRLRPVAATAVDPLEIAATLEADGINDAIAQRLGHPDVFSLAAYLFTKVGRAPVPAPVAGDPWRSRASHHLFRGALFGLPGLCYVAAAHALSGTRALAVVVLSLLLAWTASEFLAYVGYHWIGRRDRKNAARILQLGFAAAVAVIVPVVLLTGWLIGAGSVGTGFAVGQAFYLLAATLALTMGAEKWLLGALLPLIAGSAHALLASAEPGAELWRTAAVSVALTTLVALIVTTTRRSSTGTLLSRTMIRTGLGQAAFGLLAGALLTFATLWAVAGPGGGAAVITVVALPLSLTMGIAELMLYRYRRYGFRQLNRSVDLAAFARGARQMFALSVAGYLGVLALSAFGLSLLLSYTGTGSMSVWALATAVVLGGALFAGLVLRSFGDVRVMLLACAAALVAEAVLSAAGLGVEPVQLGVCAVLCAGLVGRGLAVLGRASVHH